MNRHGIRNGRQQGSVGWRAAVSSCSQSRDFHDARLIYLLPPELAVAIRGKGVAEFSLQPALRQTRKHRLNFGGHLLQIISESLIRHSSQFSVRLEISELTINQDVVVKPLQGQ